MIVKKLMFVGLVVALGMGLFVREDGGTRVESFTVDAIAGSALQLRDGKHGNVYDAQLQEDGSLQMPLVGERYRASLYRDGSLELCGPAVGSQGCFKVDQKHSTELIERIAAEKTSLEKLLEEIKGGKEAVGNAAR